MKSYIKHEELRAMIKNVSVLFNGDFNRQDNFNILKERIRLKKESIESKNRDIEYLKENGETRSRLMGIHWNHNGYDFPYQNGAKFFLTFLSLEFPEFKDEIDCFSKSKTVSNFCKLESHFKQDELMKTIELTEVDPFGSSPYQIELDVNELNNIMAYSKYSKDFLFELSRVLHYQIDIKNNAESFLFKTFKDWFLEYKDLELNDTYFNLTKSLKEEDDTLDETENKLKY